MLLGFTLPLKRLLIHLEFFPAHLFPTHLFPAHLLVHIFPILTVSLPTFSLPTSCTFPCFDHFPARLFPAHLFVHNSLFQLFPCPPLIFSFMIPCCLYMYPFQSVRQLCAPLSIKKATSGRAPFNLSGNFARIPFYQEGN